jgi:uncharacterized protein YigA (DUF484 family)
MSNNNLEAELLAAKDKKIQYLETVISLLRARNQELETINKHLIQNASKWHQDFGELHRATQEFLKKPKPVTLM